MCWTWREQELILEGRLGIRDVRAFYDELMAWEGPPVALSARDVESVDTPFLQVLYLARTRFRQVEYGPVMLRSARELGLELEDRTDA